MCDLVCNCEPFKPDTKPADDEDYCEKLKKRYHPEVKAIEYKPIHLVQQEDPWRRLHITPTVQSTHRQIFYFNPLAPHDSLDFVLKSVYNQSTDFMKRKPAILLQQESLRAGDGRKLKKQEGTEKETSQDHPLRIVEIGKVEDFNSIKLAIESHHTQITNRGYCRKPDGGYFST